MVLPADEAPHDFQTEWWYFNLHLSDEAGGYYVLHDVVFQVQETASNRTLYVRQIGLADVADGSHATSERVRAEAQPLADEPDGFVFDMGSWHMSGEGGTRYRLAGGAGGISYDVTLVSAAPALLHDDDGLVDFGPSGVSYYYTRPRLDATGTLTTADGRALPVSGLGWLDKQWGNFQATAVGWDWASIQLDDGTDLMLSRLFQGDHDVLSLYGTLRRPGEPVRRLGPDDLVFEPLPNEWRSPDTGTVYRPAWQVRVLGDEPLVLTLEPGMPASEFVSSLLGVAYLEVGVRVMGPADRQIGQGFVELNWSRVATR